MNFKVYEQEIKDGLTKAIQDNTTLAYITEAKPYNPSKKIKDKLTSLIATANTDIKQKDLFYINSVLVSVGWNNNDDVFTPKDTWLARSTPVDKPFNFMHNEKDIIGHMTASLAVDKNGDVIDDDIAIEDIPDQFDIVVASVLYKTWSDDKLQSRMDGIVETIPNGDWFVSMECLFPGFDYAIVTPKGEHKVVARNKDSAFLTKHLRIYGGSGEWNGNKIGRILRGFSFCGKGLVDSPANERSVILSSAKNFDVENFNSKNTVIVNDDSQNNNEQEIEMSEALQAQVDKLQADLKISQDREATLVADAQAKAEKAFKNEKETLEASIASLTSDAKTEAVEATAKNTKITEFEETIAQRDKSLVEAKTSIETLTQEKTDAGRLTKLVEAGVKTEDAKAIVERWTSASDEQFEDIVTLHADAFGHVDDNDDKKNKKDKKDKNGKDKKKDKGKGSEIDDSSDPEGEASASSDLDNAEIDTDPNMSTADEDVIAETRKAVASWLGDTVLNHSKPKNQK